MSDSFKSFPVDHVLWDLGPTHIVRGCTARSDVTCGVAVKACFHRYVLQEGSFTSARMM